MLSGTLRCAESDMWRRILRISLLVLLLAALAVVVLYFQASRIPSDYRPAQLSGREREQAARQFVSQISDFNNKAQLPQPFEWQITQEQANRYLAAADEIAANRLGGRPGEVREALESVGLSDPAVSLNDSILALLVRSSHYDKVVSADIRFTFLDDGRLQIRLAQTWVGQLPVPDALLRSQLERLKQKLAREQAQTRVRPRASSGEEPSSDEVGRLIASVISAIDEAPIDPVLVGGLNNKKVRIESIRIHDGKLTLRAVPVERTPARRAR